jgi:hypothetical protein
MNKGIAKGLVAAGLGLAIFASPAVAQNPGPEFGIQFVGFSMVNPDGDDNNTTVFGFGNGNVTMAYYLSEMIAIEPTVTFVMMKPEGGGDSQSEMGIGVAVPIYLKKMWGKGGGLFVAPHIGMFREDGGPGDATSQNHIGVSVGTKLRISDDFFWRVQATYDTAPENDDYIKSSTMGVSFGMTAYWP